MMRGMNAAISGLEASQTMLDVTANNLANSDTIGYKSQRTTFEDELSQNLTASTGQGAYNGGSNAQQVGLGVQLGSIDNMMTTGVSQTTGNPLDVAIQGDGFFQVGTGDPTKAPDANTFQYTQAGNFTLNANGYLMTQSGQYVVGEGVTTTGGTSQPSGTESYIKVPPGSTNIAIGQDGAVTYSNAAGTTVTAGYLEIATFPNQAGLTRDGGSMWSASPSSGTASRGTPDTAGFAKVAAGQLEGSNVDMATEFSNMITAERGYQADSKVITTADEMLQTLVNMPQG